MSRGNRELVRSLRHRGKIRYIKEHIETRGKIRITNSIHDRPAATNDGSEFGHWGADTVAGKVGGVCLVTLIDRHSLFLLAGKILKRSSANVAEKMVELLTSVRTEQIKSITPDRGKEFSKHFEVTKSLGNVPFYFPDPHAPWQRRTNENTNGLIREFLPKTKELDTVEDQTINQMIEKLNNRSRKTPFEVFFDRVLHLI